MLIAWRSPGAERGFTMIELMITVTLLAILMALAVPYVTSMVRNNRVRTVTETLQNGIRTAQAEAVRRSRQTVFSLTAAEPGDTSAAVANGSNWAIHTIPPVLNGEARDFIQGGVLADFAAGVTITGPASICFNSIGRLTVNNAPGVVGANCLVNAAQPPRYDITVPGADRPLSVMVALGGQVRMCDPARTLSAASPEGCP
ncbi:MAG TPA: prepilin-type N-terminal cleavage/methylation domain-containing protein [Albitalea sp.]|jgi:type IV fimbrial biogenesis protein FimT|nr:prepilin-type N-terminal cleavage/methylation domain-containing protein [Albitalea sp.]